MQLVAIFLTLFLYGANARQVDFCFAEDDDPYLFHATKTSYHFVHGGKTRFQTIPYCHPVQMWMISRHGPRYPKSETITKLSALPQLRDQIVHNHEHRMNGHMCDRDLDNLKLWNPNPNMTPEWAHRLTPEGGEDSMLLARRLQSNFPELLQPYAADINSQNYKFRSTKSERTESSMAYFMQGLFGRRDAVAPIDVGPDSDNLLRAYKNCSKWQDGLEQDTASVNERNKFLSGPEVNAVVQNVSRRLGFQYSLTAETIQKMYDMCRFEKAWDVGKLSPWCAVFTREELLVMEYVEDLFYYYNAGSGREVNSHLGCAPLRDMFNNFKLLERGNMTGEPRGIFYFTHTVTLINFLSTLGIGKDRYPLTATNYREMEKRKFRTSFMSPFNGNLLAVFYRCKGNDGANKVMFYLQEKPLMLEGCQVGLCDWEYLKNKFGTVVSECDTNFCSGSNGVDDKRAMNLINVLIPSVLLVLMAHWRR